MNPYLEFVESIQTGIAAARGIFVSGKTEPVSSGSCVLLFSPHPDDECITGLLPLRLMREAGKRIINIPVTFGSNVARQAGRAEELKNACAYLGWENFTRAGNVQPLDVADVVAILKQFLPEIMFMPHAHDWNSRHIETHFLVEKALKKMGAGFSCTVVETEFWGAMDDPNLMVEGDAQTVADLVAATSLHVGEVARNPYHLLLPAWMQDNVRRGGELVGGQGGAVPDFSFATLYRARKWQGGEWVELFQNGKTLAMGAENLREIF
ncbi:MAG: PIG-L family deacetylase [Kiritimatiellales bacterium]|nr:PIG-L family deacetylase [Kiritimatiellales bacterium]